MTHIPLDDETVSYILRYGGRCRECADNPSQICVIGGLPCNVDAARKVIRHTITALNYGIEHGFLAIGVPSPSIREAVEWQPIETAPKDGTRILLMAVRSKRLKLIPEIRWVKLASWRPHHHDGYEEAWREDAVACPGDMSRLQLVPSHWLPLPSPPSPAGEPEQ